MVLQAVKFRVEAVRMASGSAGRRGSGMDRVRDLLAQAVECLDSGGDGRAWQGAGSGISAAGNSGFSAPSNSNPGSSRVLASRPLPFARRGGGVSWQAQAFAERNTLFNYASGSKRKGAGAGTTSGRHKGKESKKKRSALWSHEFICLARTDQDRTPSPMQRSELITAGLGRKSISFMESGDADDINFELTDAFPKLKEGGGFELLRVIERGRMLEVIPVPPDGYTVPYLKDVVQQAKVYIRPIQRSLSMEPFGAVSGGPKEECLVCGELIPLINLRQHAENCRRAPDGAGTDSPILINEESDQDSDIEDLPPAFGQFPETRNSYSDPSETEEAMVRFAVSLSQGVTPAGQDSPSLPCQPTPLPSNLASLKDVLNELHTQLKAERCEFQVRRGHVLEDLLRETRKPSFDPLRKVTTWFIGEAGKDTGGITRELWRLLGQGLVMLCDGQEDKLVFRHDSTKVQEGVFKRVGILVGMSLVQGGSGFPFFAPAMYEYISGKGICDIFPSLEEIPDPQLKATLIQLTEAVEDADVRRIAGEACDVLLDCGLTKPLARMSVTDVPHLIRSAALHSTILKVKAELDQFVDGLLEAGVLSAIKMYPDLFESLFVASQASTFTADSLLQLLENKIFSPVGSSSFEREQTAYIYFRDLLADIERGEADISFGDILAFFTGTNSIPPTGFPFRPTLNFSDINPYPTASTCGISLTLPSKYNDYTEFKDHFIYAMQNHGGFGLC